MGELRVPAENAAVRNLILAIADTKLLLGYHYGEWTFGPPALEAAVACCSLAQTEFGHVRLLHGVLRAVFGDDPDALVEQRDSAALASVPYLHQPIREWVGLVAANCVVDRAMTRVLQSFSDSSFKPVRGGLEKMIEEELFHLHHGRGCLRTAGRGAERERLGQRVSEALSAVAAWLGPDAEPEDEALVAAGVKQVRNSAIRDQLIAEIQDEARAAGVPLPRPAWSAGGWRPDRRRGPGADPDPEILEHLRGTRNQIFKVA